MKELAKKTLMNGHLFAVLLMATLALFLSCEETTGPGDEPQEVTRKLLIYVDKETIAANSGSAEVMVKVYADEDTTNAVSGVRVTFSANNAYVQTQNDITDAGGYARAKLYAGSKAGTASVSASIENFSNTVFVTVTSGSGLVSADPTSILANGVSEATIYATVVDSTGQPSPGSQVNFTTTSGTITPQAFTNENGKATAILRSTASTTDITATVTASTPAGKIAAVGKAAGEGETTDDDASPPADETVIPADETAKPAASASGEDAEKTAATLGTASIVFRGITLSGTVERETVLANSADSTLVTITLAETTSGDPLAGSAVTFSTTKGELRDEAAVTDENGEVEVYLYGGSVSGTALFTAEYVSNITYTAQLSLIKELYMTIESSPSVLSANGTDQATIRAIVYDADNNPVEGETVYFSSSLGRILPSAQTDEWGEAVVTLRSARRNGTAVVSARYQTVEKTTTIQFTGAESSMSASPLILVADGSSKSRITISVTDASGAAVVGNMMTVSTSMGTLYAGDGGERGTSYVDSTGTDGKIVSYLSSDQSGDAIVRVATEGLQDSVKVHFTDYLFTVSAETPSILAGGETTRLTATLLNKDGDIMPLTAGNVEFSPTLGEISDVTANDDGTVGATLTSGSTAGSSTVTASIADPQVTSSTTVVFSAADVGAMSLEAMRNSVRVGGQAIEIVARVSDKTGNPKADETVTFSIVKGPGGGEHLDAGTAVTNSVGQATVSFISGMTGSKQNGVEILGRVGNITDAVTLTITGQPDTVVVGFSPASFSENNDGTYSVQVSAIVSDVNRNKVVDGTVVSFALMGDVGVIDPEVGTANGVAATEIVYSPSDAGKQVQVVVSSGGKEDIKTFTLPGAAGTVAQVKLSKAVNEIQADGVATAQFAVTLTGVDGQPLSNATVLCSADIGSVQPSAVTGDPSNPDSSPGKAFITYTGPALREDSQATLTFTAGDKTATATIDLKGISLNSSLDPAALPSDGQSKSRVRVLVKETTSNIPITGAQVRFGSSDGYIGGSAYTDDNGVAETDFTAGYNAGETLVMVNYGATLIDTLRVDIREVQARGIDLSANPTQIAANGISTSTISALLRDDNYNPIIGEQIRFSTTMGTITAADSTNENGRAEATLVSDRRNGQAVVTATFNEHITTIPINFTGVRLNVSATPENLFAGGDQDSEISAIVKDAADVPIVGEDVTFTWYMDGIEQESFTSTTDVQGRAAIQLSSEDSGNAMIYINSAGARDSIAVTFTRMQFTIHGESESIRTGGETMNVYAELYDTVSESHVSGVPVQFNSTLGSITREAVTDGQGQAHTVLTSGETAGQFTVSASADLGDYRVSTEKQFSFLNAAPANVRLSVDANIVAIGENNSALTAVVTDANGNPVSNALVSFRILDGPAGGERIHPATVTTGLSGAATTYFYSGQVASEFEGVRLQAVIGDIVSNDVNLTISGAPAVIRPSFYSDWALNEIDNNDGTYTLPISATVLDINSNSVVDGTTVYFNISPAEGAVNSPVVTTNSVASSTITYPSASAGREVLLTASAGGVEDSLRFALPGFTITYLSTTAAPKTIPADGNSQSVITATLFDKNGSSANVPDGTTVSFTTDGGTLDPVVAKTVNGKATTVLTSDRTPSVYTSVTAQVGVYTSSTTVYFDEIGSSVNQVSDIEVAAEPTTIEADGIESTDVTARLFRYGGLPIEVPTTVEFESTLGQITQYVRSDSSGVAMAHFSSGEVGTATITASVGSITGYTTVNVTPGPPQSVELDFSPDYVNVRGSGKNETLIITADVKDSKNNPVEDGRMVQFQLVGQLAGADDTSPSLTPAGPTQYVSAPVPTLNGEATVSFHAGTQAGAVRVRATMVDENGTPLTPLVTSETTQFMVYSGPPYLNTETPSDPFTDSRLTIFCEQLNIYANRLNPEGNLITVTIADQYMNPVPEGTAVWFTTTGGMIATASGVTDENGMATVRLFQGNPLPTQLNSSSVDNPNTHIPGSPASFNINTWWDFDDDGLPDANDGIALVTAYTEGLDQDGRNVSVWNYAQVVFSGPVAVFTVVSDDYSLDIGDTANLVITISDANGNPVAPGPNSQIVIDTIDGAEISPRTINITGDPGTTKYYVSITNDKDPLTDSASQASVTVNLTSPNGDITKKMPTPLTLTVSP